MKIFFIASIVFFIGTSNIFSQDWKFIAYGDTRNDNPEHREVMHSMLINTPDAKFILSSGDVVDNGDVLSQWQDLVHICYIRFWNYRAKSKSTLLYGSTWEPWSN